MEGDWIPLGWSLSQSHSWHHQSLGLVRLLQDSTWRCALNVSPSGTREKSKQGSVAPPHQECKTRQVQKGCWWSDDLSDDSLVTRSDHISLVCALLLNSSLLCPSGLYWNTVVATLFLLFQYQNTMYVLKSNCLKDNSHSRSSTFTPFSLCTLEYIKTVQKVPAGNCKLSCI